MWTAVPPLWPVNNLADPSMISRAFCTDELRAAPLPLSDDTLDRHDTIPAPPWLGEALDPADPT